MISHRAEQLRLRRPQCIVATAVDSVLCTEMTDLEPQEEGAPKRVLWCKPMAWLGVIWSHLRDEAWSVSLWQTLFALAVGTQNHHRSQLKPPCCPRHVGAKGLSWRPSVIMLPRVLITRTPKTRGQRCGDTEIAVYLSDTVGPVNLVMDICITHESRGSTSDPVLNVNLHFLLPSH